MDEHELVIKSYQLIRQDFVLDEEFNADVDQPLYQLHLFLTKIIKYLLDNDFNRLLNALYRIDISEIKVKEILECAAPEEVASNLAVAIIEREKQKVIFREKYKNG